MAVASNDHLAIWTVTENPSDYPGLFVARMSLVTEAGPVVTDRLATCPRLKVLQTWLAEQGLTRLPRQPDDDPVIVECWL